MALVSIIIPAYNIDGYIKTCIDSVISQTFTDLEVIVINDGSTDNTGCILDDYSKRDCRIKVIHKSNAGVSAARNDGLKAAQGKYLLFFDGDDFSEPYTIAELVKIMQIEEPDVLLYGYHRWRDGEITKTSLPIFPEGRYEGKKIITDLLSRFVGISNEGINNWIKGEKDGLYVENPALWRCMVRSSVISNNALEFDVNLKIGEDTVFISDVLSCAKRCYVLHKPYYYLVYRESSAIATYEKNAVKKLDGKKRLLIARIALTDRVLKRSGVDIKSYWQGTVVMSDAELAFLFALRSGEMSFMHRYRSYLSYASLDEVRQSVKLLKLKTKINVKIFPFLLLKLRLNFLLFICAVILGLCNYEFSRE